jgi:hypothetical protein
MLFAVSMINRRKGKSEGGRLRYFAALWLATLVAGLTAHAAPRRLIVALDGIAYRDLVALQSGVTCTNFWGRTFQRRAFTAEEGYFPASRMISTFPSVSDMAWTDIFGDRPLPGYQRTYYCEAIHSVVSINGVTTTMEHERQMDWQVQNGFLRALGYMFPAHTFRYEMRGTVENFWQSTNDCENYYVYVRASDDSQHMDRDILGLLCELDRRLQDLRARYQAREGRDLQILILSDHGHNHAGRGIRVKDAAFLEQHGYHVARSITNPTDVVLPIVGIESWVEVHCDPAATAKLASLFCQLQGADIVTATIAGDTNRFLVFDTKGGRAEIGWNRSRNSFRYVADHGDPLDYLPAVQALGERHQLDANGFASANDWMTATMTNHYPLALERIARGLTCGTLNPATIIISLDNHYVNDNWYTDAGSRLVTCRSTHGGLDDLCSDGIVLSNFARTRDTSTDRVASQFDNFPGVRDFRAEQSGAELVTKSEQALVRIPHVPFDQDYRDLPGGGIYLRIWSPRLAGLAADAPVEVVFRKDGLFNRFAGSRKLALNHPVAFADDPPDERVYALPPHLGLDPLAEYEMAGWSLRGEKSGRLFDLTIHTQQDGEPAPF